MSLAAIVLTAVAFSGQPCVAIDGGHAAWARPTRRATTSRVWDYGDNFGIAKVLPRTYWYAFNAAATDYYSGSDLSVSCRRNESSK